jgi:hypothetical protein
MILEKKPDDFYIQLASTFQASSIDGLSAEDEAVFLFSTLTCVAFKHLRLTALGMGIHGSALLRGALRNDIQV